VAEKERQKTFNWFLDKEEQNKLLVRFVYSPDGKSLESFAIIYCALIDGKIRQIVRYDCSEREEVHLHQFFRKPAVKRHLSKEKTFDTMKEFVALIEKNWRQYLLSYKEKRI